VINHYYSCFVGVHSDQIDGARQFTGIDGVVVFIVVREDDARLPETIFA